jgi:Ca-activated chloride channel family protein
VSQLIWHSVWVLALIPFWIFFTFLAWRLFERKKSAIQFSAVAQFKNLPKSWKVRWRFLPYLFFGLAGVFLLIALARPQTAGSKTQRNVDGIDIMIALDVSDSMLIEDMQPENRLTAAKETLKAFVKKRSSDRIGVLVFAGESFTLVPLTLDYELLLARVDEITTARNARIKDGTAIGVALANASGRLKDSTAKSRVVIFMTDGENNSGTIDPETGLSVAKGYGVKIYSIGIGKDGPTRIPVFQKDVFGNPIKTYQPFESTVNEDLLGRFASETGGKYYRASREDSLGGVFSDIDRLEKTKIEVNKFVTYTEMYPIYLRIALAVFFLGVLQQLTVFWRVP